MATGGVKVRGLQEGTATIPPIRKTPKMKEEKMVASFQIVELSSSDKILLDTVSGDTWIMIIHSDPRRIEWKFVDRELPR